MKWTDDEDPHLISGYHVNLFQCADQLFGHIGVATGSTEGVSGRMYDISFNQKTGALSFKSKFSDGWESSKEIGPEGRESRKLFAFSGKVTKTHLNGTVTLRSAYTPQKIVDRGFVSLKRQEDDFVPQSLEAWGQYRAPLPTW